MQVNPFTGSMLFATCIGGVNAFRVKYLPSKTITMEMRLLFWKCVVILYYFLFSCTLLHVRTYGTYMGLRECPVGAMSVSVQCL